MGTGSSQSTERLTTSDELLHAILPPNGEEIPSSYTQTGHIAHVNLREEWLPYKHIIGQVLLEVSGIP